MMAAGLMSNATRFARGCRHQATDQASHLGATNRRLPEQDLAFRVRDLAVARAIDILLAFVDALHRRPYPDGLEPAPQMREIIQVLAMRLMRHDPGIAGDIGDRVIAGNGPTIGEALVEDAIEPVGFVLITRNRIRHLLRRIDIEMPVLPGHGSETRHLPEQPLDGLGADAKIR